MATYRKLLCMSRFSSQSSQTDDKKTGCNGGNNKLLSKNVIKVTQEATQLMPHFTTPETTPFFSRKVEINHLLRLYSKKSKVYLRPSKGGKSPRPKPVAPRGGPSSDRFGFPPRDAIAERKMSRTKHDVLRTIKRMVEENRLIRVRLLTLKQTRRGK